MRKRRMGKKLDYKPLIISTLASNPGIKKDGICKVVKGSRNGVYKDIQELLNDKTIDRKKDGGLYLNPKNIPNFAKKRENLQGFLKNFRQAVWENIFPRIETNAKKSGKPIFYTESAALAIGIDARTGKPMTGYIQRINEVAKQDLLDIATYVNQLIRASFSLYTTQIFQAKKENIEEIEKEQKAVLKEIKKTHRKLREMTAEGYNDGRTENVLGQAVCDTWWYSLTSGLEMEEDGFIQYKR